MNDKKRVLAVAHGVVLFGIDESQAPQSIVIDRLYIRNLLSEVVLIYRMSFQWKMQGQALQHDEAMFKEVDALQGAELLTPEELGNIGLRFQIPADLRNESTALNAEGQPIRLEVSLVSVHGHDLLTLHFQRKGDRLDNAKFVCDPLP